MPSYRFRSEKYVSRGYKDLSITFRSNPSTGDFGIVKNENAIKQAVRNLLLTDLGERPFQPSVGSRIKGLLFEPWDVFTADEIKGEIRNCLKRLEPRIEVTKVSLQDDSDINAIAVELDYTIVGETVVQTIEFLLEKA
jgi:phage baseplate assembly protein W